MRRRALLKTALIVTAWAVTGGHTPYRQWQVYRQRHLLIGASKSEMSSKSEDIMDANQAAVVIDEPLL